MPTKQIDINSLKKKALDLCEGINCEKDIDEGIKLLFDLHSITTKYDDILTEYCLKKNDVSIIKKLMNTISKDPFNEIFARGYLITDKINDDLENIWVKNTITFNSTCIYVYHHNKVNVSVKYNQNEQYVCIIGIAFNVLSDKSDNEILLSECLSNLSIGIDNFLTFTNYLAGNYVILFGDNNNSYIITDATGCRPVYYHQNKMLFSSHYLLIQLLESESITPVYEQYCKMNPRPFSMPGDYTPYNHILSLIPNHIINTNNKEIKRYWPNKTMEIVGEDQFIRICKLLLNNELKQIVSKYNTIMSITGGHDSRLSLAASCKYSQLIRYFMFRTTMDDTKEHLEIQNDHEVSKYISDKIKIKYDCFPYLTTAHYRALRKLRHYSQLPASGLSISAYYPDADVVIRSNLIELIREKNVYSWKTKDDGSSSLEIKQMINFVDHPYNEVSDEAFKDFISRNEFDEVHMHQYNAQHMFYWEHRMALWSNQKVLDEYHSVDVIMLFNCRFLLDLGMRVYKKDNNSEIIDRMIEEMWPELSGIPYSSISGGKKNLKKIKLNSDKDDNNKDG